LPLANGKVLATLKHMTGHGQPESGTNIGPAQVSERVLREAFFPPFKRIIEETGVGAIMPSYNEIDGQPSHASVWLLRDILRKEWGYQGLTVSDYFGNRELITRHRLAADNREAAIRALLAGVDVETPDPETYKELPALVREGAVPETLIDEAVRRVLSFKFEAGLFENPYVDEAAADALFATPASIALSRRAATRSAVLLKNDGVLPLEAKKIKRLLVLGTHAVDTPIGGYSDIPTHVVSVLDGLRAEGKQAGFEVDYAVGVGITKERIWGQDAVNFIDPEVNRQHIREAVERAKHADHIVMVLGDNEQTSREAWADAHLGDRDSLELMGEQNELAAAIFALKKPTVVFLLNGRPLSINFLDAQANAIVEGWYLGQETGHAAADLLFGRANPGGKLPVSIPRSVGQLPVFYNHKPSARRGYLAGSVKPLYPFGYGLSYTKFEISEPVLAKASIGVNDSVAVDVTVKNVGRHAGDEVVQLYVRDDFASVTRPVKELKHFKRIHLQPGESQQVSFTLKPADLAFYNVAMKWVVEPGTFTIYAGPDSEQLKSAVLTVQG
jgi:beta-glucosidase